MPTDAIAKLIRKLTTIGPVVWAERAAHVSEAFFRQQRNIAIAEAARLGMSRRKSAQRFGLSKSAIHRAVDAQRRIDLQPPEDSQSEE